MRPKRAQSAFEKHLKRSGLELVSLTPAQGIDAMLTFYQAERAKGCDLDADADMLLFQWGTNDWGDGEYFDLDITRQLIFGGFEDENIWQLSLRFRFAPSEKLRSLDAGNRWCRTPDLIPGFQEFIYASGPYQTVKHQSAEQVRLQFGCAG